MKRAAEFEQQIAAYQTMVDIPEAPATAVAVGSLVELQQGQRKSHYFLVNAAGGLTLSHQGRTINVITTQSPLGDALLGSQPGDEIEVEAKGRVLEYEVLSIK
jgi:transcription elongation GreA/GreB family factor